MYYVFYLQLLNIIILLIYPQRACVRRLQCSVCLSVRQLVILSHNSGSLKTVASWRLKDSSKCCTGQFNHECAIILWFDMFFRNKSFYYYYFALLIVSFCWWCPLLSHGNHLANNFLLPAVVLLPILSGLLKCWNWSSPLKLAVRWVSLACLASFMKKHLHLSFHNMNYASTCMSHVLTCMH